MRLCKSWPKFLSSDFPLKRCLQGLSPLMAVCHAGCADCVHCLLVNGCANIHLVDECGRSALHFVCMGCDAGNGNGSFSPRRKSLVAIAAARERLAIVAELINLGLDPSVPDQAQFETPLMLACETGLENVASYLLALGVKVNMASKVNSKVLRFHISSLKKLFEIYQTGNTALHSACKGKMHRFAEMLLLHGADSHVENVSCCGQHCKNCCVTFLLLFCTDRRNSCLWLSWRKDEAQIAGCCFHYFELNAFSLRHPAEITLDFGRRNRGLCPCWLIILNRGVLNGSYLLSTTISTWQNATQKTCLSCCNICFQIFVTMNHFSIPF